MGSGTAGSGVADGSAVSAAEGALTGNGAKTNGAKAVSPESDGGKALAAPADANAKIDAAAVAAAREAAVEEARSRLVLREKYYEDLQHGDKGVDYQKYIVLHDTEGDGPAEGILSYWEGNGNLVAAHFIVEKDGSILQCVPMDQIAHHAGWGSGNANERFGITEDGRDDLRGRAPSSTYTDYGMNAWSIGIEMVHVGGETYPEAQLEAVDNLIAYIDAYYGGNGGTIIDHKMWRAGNSDTNPEFADYLANYQDHRTHD
ncbi:MAG: peptidoglycan recognition family protein [Olegusella sp.]|nr:peptidoglycan recognition family protein [Olegusella sp.]